MATESELPLVQISWEGLTPQAVPFAEAVTGNSPWGYLLSPRVRFAIHSGGLEPEALPNIREITNDSRWGRILDQHVRFFGNEEDAGQPVFRIKIVLDRDHRLMNGRRFSPLNFTGSMRPFSMRNLMILVSPQAQGGKFWVNFFAQVRTWCERATEHHPRDAKAVFGAN